MALYQHLTNISFPKGRRNTIETSKKNDMHPDMAKVRCKNFGSYVQNHWHDFHKALLGILTWQFVVIKSALFSLSAAIPAQDFMPTMVISWSTSHLPYLPPLNICRHKSVPNVHVNHSSTFVPNFSAKNSSRRP